ncbi:MAG: glycosyltransferase [Clostridia bacterium]|nr:glycosyltransferase [Clostridia bacterium]
MKVCDVVLNSIWHDPRVRRQICEYVAQGVELCCVGMRCIRYDEEKVAAIPCPTTIVEMPVHYQGKQRNLFRKLLRERVRNRVVCDAIVAYQPDVIHANDLNALIPAYQASRILGCKLIYDSHEICVENFFTGNKKAYALFLKSKERRMCKHVDKMVCVSHAAADYFAKEYHIPTPMVVTNCALRSEQHVATDKHEGFEVLNHGKFYAGRGYDIMVEAAPLLQEHSDIKLALRGFGTMEQQLRDRASQLNAQNVVFYPPVLVQELIPYASKSAVGVAMTEAICLNFKMSVSNKLFEYAAAGLPVIMSDIPEHRYLNDKYAFGIVLEENTPQEFAKAAIKLYTDKDFYNTCAENAKRMSEELNWEIEFGQLIEFERSCVNKD